MRGKDGHHIDREWSAICVKGYYTRHLYKSDNDLSGYDEAATNRSFSIQVFARTFTNVLSDRFLVRYRFDASLSLFESQYSTWK